MAKQAPDDRLVFLDLETTGLDPDRDKVLEVGVIVVGCDLRVRGGVPHEFQSFVGYPGGYPLRHLVNDKFVLQMHTDSGLCEAYDALSTTHRLQMAAVVERKVVQFLEEQHQFKPGTATLAGFCPQFDMSFLRRHMPILTRMFDYRHVDVSTIRGLLRRWVDPGIDTHVSKLASSPTDVKHRAVSDCYGALRELALYQAHLFDVDGFGRLQPEDVRTPPVICNAYIPGHHSGRCKLIAGHTGDHDE
jgi:oligoribonuclease